MEVVSIDLDITSDRQISWRDELHSLIDVLILSSLQEWSLNDTRILLSWLKDRDGVISEVEGDNEPPVNVLGNLGVEPGGESQDLLVVVHVLEEVDLWLLRDKVIDVAQRVYLVTETVVRWHLDDNCLSWLHWHDVADWEVPVISVQEVVLGELVDSLDSEDSAVGDEVPVELDLIAGEISVTDELLTWLIHSEGLWQLLSPEVDGEGIPTVVGVMNFSDLNGIVSKEVVPDELEVLAGHKESQNLSVIIQELFLGWNSASSEFLLEEFKELLVFFWWNWFLRLNKGVLWAVLGISLGYTAVLYKIDGYKIIQKV